MADPTQILRFLEARFGAEVPNVCAWRRATVGDLTSSFNIAVPTIQFRSNIDAHGGQAPIEAPTETGR